MIGLSPKGILEAVAIFPIMFVIALVLDILTILLTLTVVGGIVLGVIGFLTVGLWIIIRSGGERSPSRDKKDRPVAPEGEGIAAKEGEAVAAKEGGMVAAKEGEMVAAREGAEVAAKTAGKSLLRIGLRMGAVTVLKFIPVVNVVSSVIFGWTMMVLWEAVSDLQSFSLEEGQ